MNALAHPPKPAATSMPGPAANPATIAREAIRQLAVSRVAPTPENFARAYREACGGADAGGSGAAAVEPEQVLSQLVQGITTRCPDLSSVLRLQEHVKHRAWSNALKEVNDTVGEALSGPSREWPRILRQLLTQLEITHADWTRARKLAAVSHILAAPSADDRTREKLERLMAAWSIKPEEKGSAGAPLQPEVAGAAPATADLQDSTGTAMPAEDRTEELKAWRLLALTALDLYQGDQPRAPGAATTVKADTLGRRLARFTGVPGEDWLHEIHAAATSSQAETRRQTALRDRLVKLLRLVCENLTLFADDDAWVNGQVARITQLLEAPLDEQSLTEAEDSLRLAVQRQSELKTELDLAKSAVKEMLASLVDRLATAASSTGEFHQRLGARAEAIRVADDLPSLSRVVATLLDDADEMRAGMQRTHGELNSARESIQQHEARVQALEQELADVSSLVRIDPLTKVLNRRGLDEAILVEQSRADREGKPLAIALLDIDNFKALNDSFGHGAGDEALKYFSNMVRAALRPGDTVARYGGEEFVILLPATTATEAVNILSRTQRQLTRTIFLHNDEKILMTFSAGVTDYRRGDTNESAVRRADTATYLAKAAGKNRVHIG